MRVRRLSSGCWIAACVPLRAADDPLAGVLRLVVVIRLVAFALVVRLGPGLGVLRHFRLGVAGLARVAAFCLGVRFGVGGRSGFRLRLAGAAAALARVRLLRD